MRSPTEESRTEVIVQFNPAESKALCFGYHFSPLLDVAILCAPDHPEADGVLADKPGTVLLDEARRLLAQKWMLDSDSR